MWQCGHSQRVEIGSNSFPQKSHGMAATLLREVADELALGRAQWASRPIPRAPMTTAIPESRTRQAAGRAKSPRSRRAP
jgi:hypothetical protein